MDTKSCIFQLTTKWMTSFPWCHYADRISQWYCIACKMSQFLSWKIKCGMQSLGTRSKCSICTHSMSLITCMHDCTFLCQNALCNPTTNIHIPTSCKLLRKQPAWNADRFVTVGSPMCFNTNSTLNFILTHRTIADHNSSRTVDNFRSFVLHVQPL